MEPLANLLISVVFFVLIVYFFMQLRRGQATQEGASIPAGPCQRIGPVFDELSSSYGDSMVFLKVDVDKLSGVAQTYGVSAMPTFQVFVNGQQKEQLVGADPTKLRALVLKYSKRN